MGREDGFIQEHEEGEEEDVQAHDDRLHREVDRRREAIVEADAEKLASEYREKYGRSTASKYRGDSGIVPQRLLLPSVQDPNIWGVRCKPGKEKELVRLILKKKLSLQHSKTPLEIFSAFQRDNFSGYVYVEARRQPAVLQAIKGFANIYIQNMILVPIKEYSDLLRVNKSKEQELTPGTYVRIKRGKYQGDLAVVENLLENGLEARLKIVPRLDYGKSAALFAASNTDSKRKRPAYNTSKNRPPPRLFSENDAIHHDQRNLQRRGPKSFFYQNEEYDNGYLLKDYKLTFLITENVRPSLEELGRFNNAIEDGIDLNALSMTLKNDRGTATFNNGDRVEINSGEQAGVQGRVTSTQGEIVTIVASNGVLKGQSLDVPSGNIKKKFSVGDHVRVVSGNYTGDIGMVVNVSRDNVVILNDLSRKEQSVFARDLKEASDIGGSNILGNFELHDLVQLNAQTVGCIVGIERDKVGVLGQDGHLRDLTPAQITRKLKNTFNAFATDRNGQEIRVGDTVKELHGEGRQGVILHIHRQTLFLHDTGRQENLGVFVSSTLGVTTVTVKGARVDQNQRPDQQQQRGRGRMAAPSMPIRQGGRDRIIGQFVTIGRGSQYKGLKGTVKDTTETSARIELESKNKVVTVDKTRLLFTDQGRTVSYTEFVVPKKLLHLTGAAGRGNGGGSSPWRGNNDGRTPAWNSSGGATPGGRTPGGRTPAGTRTPGWGGNAGNRTPSWRTESNATPAWGSGSKTPSYGGDGNRTPAWNAGGRTPAWNAGARTPSHGSSTPGRSSAWDAGARTPGGPSSWDRRDGQDNNDSRSQSWYGSGGDSGRTPHDMSAPTPSVNFGSAATPGGYPATPGALSAPTPGVFHNDGYDTAPTPGVYDAKTPAASAPTPGAWGAMGEGETPRYEPETP